MPERIQIEENILSKYQHHLLQDEGFSKPPPKLVPNLRNKTNDIIHYHNLKLQLELGFHLANVHCALPFDQSPWWKNYINFNTHQHTASENDFEKDFFKLINKAVFGKSFMCLFVLLWSYILIHSLQVKFLYLCLFALMCSSINSLQVKLLSFYLFVRMYWFIHLFIHCR